jgi:hypothetical protein
MQEAGPSCVLEDLQLTRIIAYLLEADPLTPNISSGAKYHGAPALHRSYAAFKRAMVCPMRRAAHR